ncbi:hypothetical protein CDAR_39831 [Caerostris darwini]|uniref:Uncharacterized protein n=1 Tax=Caerostris darwini TaxID=1538125 RepID=A0AAV4SQH2_9ARAC|nr:hypothetical protein CDAR_39831 [Caerostris darwini]
MYKVCGNKLMSENPSNLDYPKKDQSAVRQLETSCEEKEILEKGNTSRLHLQRRLILLIFRKPVGPSNCFDLKPTEAVQWSGGALYRVPQVGSLLRKVGGSVNKGVTVVPTPGR